MKSKKSPKANLERKRGLFLEIGLVLALGICLAAFEWSSPNYKLEDLGNLATAVELEEEIINTFIKEPPPPVETKEPENIDPDFTIVENDVETEKIDFTSDLKEQNSPVIKKNEEVDIPEEKDELVPFFIVEDKPSFPGGEEAMFKFISKTYVYPPVPKENGVDGTVYVQFVVAKTGKIVNPFVVGSVDSYLDAEALRLVSLFPDWIPGKQRGIAVSVTMVLPISFKLK